MVGELHICLSVLSVDSPLFKLFRITWADNYFTIADLLDFRDPAHTLISSF